MAKRPKSSNLRLIDFHFKLLLDLLQGHSEVAEAVQLLKDSLTLVNAGAKSQIFQWHLKRVKGMVPDTAEIAEAVDMLSECILYKDKL
ncbi:hypothetical protein L210DRAFT_880578 [Boletus edulis BED1]|uniref:Uncharacterized protein n=1 Tax=Boletus edulis BED1 TaxID=1328754 RepID=A0AAD4BGG1_BOLED|nr:hypothetical protein L210DRAFT_880578 [Boletus edulis BED1]